MLGDWKDYSANSVTCESVSIKEILERNVEAALIDKVFPSAGEKTARVKSVAIFEETFNSFKPKSKTPAVRRVKTMALYIAALCETPHQCQNQTLIVGRANG